MFLSFSLKLVDIQTLVDSFVSTSFQVHAGACSTGKLVEIDDTNVYPRTMFKGETKVALNNVEIT